MFSKKHRKINWNYRNTYGCGFFCSLLFLLAINQIQGIHTFHYLIDSNQKVDFGFLLDQYPFYGYFL
jgi:hypothetical protein